MNDEVAREMIDLMRQVIKNSEAHQQLLLSQRLLLLAVAETVSDAPQLNSRYQALLREHEHLTGSSLPVISLEQ